MARSEAARRGARLHGAEPGRTARSQAAWRGSRLHGTQPGCTAQSQVAPQVAPLSRPAIEGLQVPSAR